MRKIWTAVVVALFLSLSSWLAYRAYVIVPPSLESSAATQAVGGTDVLFSQNDLAEMASLASQPRDRNMVLTYSDDLPKYRKLPWMDISSTSDPAAVAAEIRPVLPARLAVYPESAKVLAGVPSDEIDALARQLGLLVTRSAGMSDDDYLKYLGPDAHFELETDSYEKLAASYRKYLPDLTPPPENATPAQWGVSFTELSKLAFGFRGGLTRCNGFSTDAAGMIGVVTETPSTVLYYDTSVSMHAHYFTPDQIVYFEGGLGKSDFLLTHWPQSSTPQATDNVLRAEVFIMLKTLGNDAYAVSYNLFYDPKTSRWWLLHIERFCSLRMGTARSFVD